MPRGETSWFTAALPVSIETLLKMDSTTPVKSRRARLPSVTPAPTEASRSGWKMRAATAAVSVERASTTRAGILRQIITPVSTGTTSSQGVIRKCARSTSAYSSIRPWSATGWQSPITVKITSVMVMEGIVLSSM